MATDFGVQVPTGMTQAQLSKRMSDQKWRLNHLYWITNKQGNAQVFKMNWAQEHLYDNLHYLNLILKARQLGITTFLTLLSLDNALFTNDIRCGLIAHTKDDVKTIFRDKVQYPFSKLPETIRAARAPSTDSANELLFSNNSSIRIATSLRGATLQFLHISEYGKICAKYPEKAQEIKTGTLNSLDVGQFISIESTAEGRAGHFFQLCEEAQNHQKEGLPLSPLDWKFFFFPWWKHPDYSVIKDISQNVLITKEVRKYFKELEGITKHKFTPGQIAWYALKLRQQGDGMKQEYPSTPEEAFEASVEGAYYSEQMTQLRLAGRIREVPWEPSIPVNTFWDLGFSDCTTIIFHQRVGIENRIIDYYEASGEALSHYVKVLQNKPYLYGRHYLPHDAEVHSLETGKTRRDALWDMGLRPIDVVPRIAAQMDGVEAVRSFLPTCYIDKENCDRLIMCLDHYRKEWDERLGSFKSTPLHDWASHGEKAFEQLALGWRPAGLRRTGRGVKARNWRTV